MKNLLDFLDAHLLKIGVAFLLIFTVLYPKLPSVHIINTWVYIRLEDFAIAAVVIFWLIQLLRKKVKIHFPFAIPIFGYWIIGGISLVLSFIFIGPHLLNFFPHLAALNFLRRIEYMILFLVAFSTIKNLKDVRDYMVILTIAVAGVILYGFGQEYYLSLWSTFPHFFQKFQFCFPSFQTGNEEFAKGVPLCLPQGARITSTFGGHYDLAAYLVVIIPIIFGISLVVKKLWAKVFLVLLSVFSLMLLIFTASRVSFIAYLIAVIVMLIFYKKKLLIVPVLLVSIAFLLLFSGSTAKRFLATFRITNIVVNNQGQLIGTAGSNLPSDLQSKLDKDKLALQKQQFDQLPTGSGFIGLPTQATATNEAILKHTLTSEEVRRLQAENGTLELSTVRGNFLVQRALVYDISFTTRFQAEWPNAIKAFLRDPLFGSGYSSITLATDNDYLRALGETGFLGFFSFIFIFIMLGISLFSIGPQIKSSLGRVVVYGMAGGVLGLFFNASLIDVFESSKVAENLWILLGIASGILFLYQKEKIDYRNKLMKVFTSHTFIALYIFLLTLVVYLGSINNFFVGDDFTWLRWAASSTPSILVNNFIDANNFFYVPLAKLIIFALYTIFAFNPQGYHVFSLFMHFVNSMGVYMLALLIFRKRLLGAISALLFVLLPSFGENIYWFSPMVTNLAVFFMLYSVLCWMFYREKNNIFYYILSLLLGVGSIFAYGNSLVLPLLILTAECFIIMRNKQKFLLLKYIPFLLLIPIYGVIRLVTHAFISGGDYSYSIPHSIANVVGNYIGYSGLLLMGEPFLPLYDNLRNGLKGNWIEVTAIILVIGIFAVAVGLKFISKLKYYYTSKNGSIILFAKVFVFISLLLYVGLGNISERYTYLAGIGFVILLVAVMDFLAKRFFTSLRSQMITLMFAVLILSSYYLIQQKIEQQEWQQASSITKNFLILFRVEYQDVPQNSHFYFVQIPTKYNNAWVFSDGVTDALWFTYRDKMPQITNTQTVADAKKQAGAKPSEKSFIFTFTQNGKVQRVSY